MGRGLSELQKSILKIAYRKRVWGDSLGNVTNREILIEVYNFPFHSPSADTTSGTPQIFFRKEIGMSRYYSASVAVVKAFNRLVKRGLAQRKHNFGILLTEVGFKAAKAVASKQRKN